MEDKIEIDIIILSYAQSEVLRDTTLNCINSLIASEDPSLIKFNILILESEKSLAPYQYPYTQTIYPDEEFGYHRYMNIGISLTSSPFICLCNNDLDFHPLWATEIVKPFKQFSDIGSASPFCSILHPKMGFKVNDGLKPGFRIRKEIAGWCLFFRRDILSIIGKLDENYIFWCADNDYANTLWRLKILHVLVTSSIVDHLESQTLNRQSEDRILELTENEVTYFEKKWNNRIGKNWYLY